MSALLNQVRAGFYLDSVALMRLSAELSHLPGVEDAVLMIGSPSNQQIMADAGLLADEGRAAGPGDLVMAVRAGDEASARDALAHAASRLDATGLSASASESRPRSLAGAMAELPDCNLALISTPGEFATREARAALSRGLNVLIFSDNVPVADERALKEQAAGADLLVMGPDCGTAYIGGTPLAFANVIEPGNIGVIAASGTGLQEFAVLAGRLGRGIRHGIGVGGRDLSDEVGGLSTLAAIDLLAADPEVAHIVLISKPPGTDTAGKVFRRLTGCGKPVTACVFGVDPAGVPDRLALAENLRDAAEHVCGGSLSASGEEMIELAFDLAQGLTPGREGIRGLFCGGTLCTEAQAVLLQAGICPTSNAPLPGAGKGGGRYLMLDLGADEYTVGRPHPMIDPHGRNTMLAEALTSDVLAVVLLDLVLGLGAHPDPAAGIVAALASAPENRPVVIASVCGTPRDPQGYERQCRALRDAGVVVMPSNADAAALAVVVARECAGH